MKKFALLSSLAAMSMFAGEWKGTISDSKCGMAHADASEKSAKCSQACVKSGKAEPVLVSDGKIYKFSDAAKVTEHVGHKVTVMGSMTGETISVDSVKMDH